MPLLTPTREALSSWQAVVHDARPRLSPDGRSDVDTATAVLGREGETLRVGAHARTLREWSRRGDLAELCASGRRVHAGGPRLALVPIDDDRPLDRDPALDLDAFIAGPANRACRDQALEFASKALQAGGVLVIQGAGRSGRTRLLRALTALIAAGSAGPRPELTDVPALSRHVVEAIYRDRIGELRERLCGSCVVAVDDASQLPGLDATQLELLFLIDALRSRGRPLLVSGIGSEGLRPVHEDLHRELEAATRVELVAPEWETRVAIVLDRLRRWGVEPETDVAEVITRHVHSDLGALDAVITELMTPSDGLERLRDPASVASALETHPPQARRPAPDEVIAAVARQFHVRIRDLRADGRTPRLSLPRQIAMHLIRVHCGLSYPEVGKCLGRHHTTAIHADRRIREQREQEGPVRSAIERLEATLSKGARNNGG